MGIFEIIKIILFGIIEGITEWLPVSSTGHLILFHKFLPLDFSEEFMDMFEYVIQLSAIGAVILFFWKKIFPFKKEKVMTEKGEKNLLKPQKETFSLWLKIVVACVPALFAFLVDKLLLENINDFAETVMIACALILYGVVFLLVENRNENRRSKIRTMQDLSLKTAFWIGCFQVLAIIPGTSRSGITIIGALLLSVTRTVATEFTFFLAIPVMVGASGYKILGFFLDGNVLVWQEGVALALGCAVAFLVSLACIKFLMNFVRKYNFRPFGWYRIFLGLIVFLALAIPHFF